MVPGVLSIGDLFNGTMTTYRQGFGRFMKLLVAPIIIAIVLFTAVVAAVVVLMIVPLAARTPSDVGVGLIPATLLIVVTTAAISIIYYVYMGRAMVATVDLATGRTLPTGANLAERTRGLAGRIVVMVLLIVGLVLLAYLLLAVLMGLLVFATMNDGGEPNAAAIVLVFFAFVVSIYWFTVKLMYVLPIMAEEGVSALEGIKRSWSMTKGRFWSTLGRYLLISILVGVIASVSQILGGPALAGATAASQSGNDVLAGVLGFVAFLVVMAVTLLLVPAQTIWVALMYLSRRRELAGEPPSEALVRYPAGDAAMPWQQQPSGTPQPGPQGQPPYGQAQHGQAPYGQGQPPQQDPGQPTYGQPTYGQPPQGHPTQGPPGGEASHPPPPQDLDRPDGGSSPWQRPDDRS